MSPAEIPNSYPLSVWVIFNAVVIVFLLLDLFVFHKKDHEIKFKEAFGWVIFWILMAMGFNVGVRHYLGSELALQFLTGYIIELSLSVDNLFVFLLIFNYFKTPKKHQYKILFWGILGVILMRGAFIILGVVLIQKFSFMMYIFGAVLIISGLKLFFEKDKEVDPEANIVVRLFKRFCPVTHHDEDGHFFVRHKGVLMATPLFITFLAINVTDFIFAVDSVPAVLAITKDPFIVYTSNIIAVMGLRAMYFVLAGMMTTFYLLHYGLALILIFIGVKMFIANFFHMPIEVALMIVVGALALSIGGSLVFPQKKRE